MNIGEQQCEGIIWEPTNSLAREGTVEIFQIDENLYQSSMIDNVERVKIFDVCIDLADGINSDASDFKIYLKWTIEDAGLPDLDILKLVASFGYDLAYKKKMNVLVHCEQGINRASLLN